MGGGPVLAIAIALVTGGCVASHRPVDDHLVAIGVGAHDVGLFDAPDNRAPGALLEWRGPAC